jgi:hypothetical protein
MVGPEQRKENKMEIITDTDLTTAEEIRERLATIRRNRDQLCDTPCKNNGIAAFQAKNAKIAKLTDREGKLQDRLCRMLREQKEQEVAQ